MADWLKQKKIRNFFLFFPNIFMFQELTPNKLLFFGFYSVFPGIPIEIIFILKNFKFGIISLVIAASHYYICGGVVPRLAYILEVPGSSPITAEFFFYNILLNSRII